MAALQRGFPGQPFYTPISRSEFHAIYAPLLNHIEPELVLILERDEAPVAFCLGVPDLLQAARGQRVDTIILKSITVEKAHRGKGLASVLVSRLNLAALPALVMANLGAGVTSLIPDVDLRRPAAVEPAYLAASIQRWRVESLFASPALVGHLADHCLSAGRTLTSLRAVFTGGAPVFPRILDKASRTAPLARVAALYGSAEAEPMALLRVDQLTAADRANIARGAGLPAGKPISELELCVLRDRWGQPLGDGSADEMDALRVPPGTVGEIAVSGPHVVTGYVHARGDAATKIRAGGRIWHRTGDSGRLDDQNRLWLTGRCSARVGEPPRAVYPLTVEAALADHPRLARTAFLSHRGERLLLLELKDPGRHFDAEELLEVLPWAGIDRVVELRHIPLDRRHNAKIDYPALHKVLDSTRI